MRRPAARATMGANDWAYGCAVLAVALSVVGAIKSRSAYPALVGVAFAAAYDATLRRSASRPQWLSQVLLVVGLVALSFALHFLYLPAGICCFFALVFCDSSALLPVAPKTKAS